ncbi:hypothetical protein BH09BAC1_BH09BAC1_07970 [soil metagenome]
MPTQKDTFEHHVINEHNAKLTVESGNGLYANQFVVSIGLDMPLTYTRPEDLKLVRSYVQDSIKGAWLYITCTVNVTNTHAGHSIITCTVEGKEYASKYVFAAPGGEFPVIPKIKLKLL